MAGRGELTSSEVTLGETTFYFKRALPMEAFDIFEELRPALAEMSEAIKAAQDSQAKGMSTESVFLGAAVDIIGRMPSEIVRKAMAKLMQHVDYQRDGRPPQKVSRDLDTAFKGQTVFTIYEVLVRAFCVNFTESLDDVKSLWEKVAVEDTPEPGT